MPYLHITFCCLAECCLNTKNAGFYNNQVQNEWHLVMKGMYVGHFSFTLSTNYLKHINLKPLSSYYTSCISTTIQIVHVTFVLPWVGTTMPGYKTDANEHKIHTCHSFQISAPILPSLVSCHNIIL